MTTPLERDVRFLKRYAMVTSTLLVVLSVAAFTRSTQHTRFDEIDVERINIREPKPRLRLVVDSLGAARIDFLDADGRLTMSLPDSASRVKR